MGPDGAKIGAGDGVGVFAVWDDLGDYGASSAGFGDDPRAAGARAALEAIERAGRPGEVPDLLWVTATPGCEEAIIAGIEEATGGSTPILGGSAADNDVSGAWRIFSGGRVHGEGVVVSALFPSAPLAHGFQSGYAPTGQSGVATRVDGRRILEIDGEPARAVYERWARNVLPVADPGEDVPVLSASTWAPLGRETGSVAGIPFHLIVHPAALSADGGVDAFATVPEGERLHAMSGSPEGLATRAARLAYATLGDDELKRGASGALIVFCGGSMLAMKHDMPKVVAGLNEVFGDIPFMGIFTFGEQGTTLDGKNLHGNLMISCLAFGKP
jgi:hypothetical protein